MSDEEDSSPDWALAPTNSVPGNYLILTFCYYKKFSLVKLSDISLYPTNKSLIIIFFNIKLELICGMFLFAIVNLKVVVY